MSDISTVLVKLKKQFPHAAAIEIDNPYQTLIAVMLSARTRDEQVLQIMPVFLRSFPTPSELAAALPARIQNHLSGIGMNKTKARHLQEIAQKLVMDFDGKVPGTMEELVSLAGVGRKTASVVLVTCFGKSAIAVDTHVHRVTNRLGWVSTSTPRKTEQALFESVPRHLHATVNRCF